MSYFRVLIIVGWTVAGCSAGRGGFADTGAGDGTQGDGAGRDSTVTTCAAGTVVCTGNRAQTCDGTGGFSSTSECGTQHCVTGMGCRACIPGAPV